MCSHERGSHPQHMQTPGTYVVHPHKHARSCASACTHVPMRPCHVHVAAAHADSWVLLQSIQHAMQLSCCSHMPYVQCASHLLAGRVNGLDALCMPHRHQPRRASCFACLLASSTSLEDCSALPFKLTCPAYMLACCRRLQALQRTIAHCAISSNSALLLGGSAPALVAYEPNNE
jgi:hypothetical protein